MKYEAFFKVINRDDINSVLPVPLYSDGYESIRKVGIGEIRTVEIKKSRRPKFHRLFMRMLRTVAENSPIVDHVDDDGNTFSAPRWRSVEHLLAAVKMALGLYDVYEMLDGKKHVVLRSISFEEMDDDEFRETVFDPAGPLLSETSGIPLDELMKESKEKHGRG